ncbi:MAG: DUF4917 family protein [Pseudomonadota bacterium]
MTKLITFEQAIEDSSQHKKRHLILGNGFSIGCKPKIFSYKRLYEQADFSTNPEIEKVFEALNTQDFEVVLRALETSATITPIYTGKPGAASRMTAHAEVVKETLVQTIASNHPAIPAEVTDPQFWACRQFLSHFLAPGGGHVFTMNYDLLLYWALMHDDMPFDENPPQLRKNDGFGNDEDDPDTDYVVWQGETSAHSADVLYLHGGLHLFDAGAQLQKYTWVRKGDSLIEQARGAINHDKFPLFVAEGKSQQKQTKIRHNAYLYQCLKVLSANAGTGTHCFFIYGHSLAKNDDHILRRLGRGRFKTLYVGIYGDPDFDDNKRIIGRARELAALRHQRNPLEVKFFDAASANVWGA